MSKISLAGCIVLYNPDECVMDNIRSYVDGLDRLFVVNNGSALPQRLSAYLKTLDNVVYILLPENQGIASALNIGASRALAEGFAWLLTMDQDSAFPDGVFAQYLESFYRLAANGELGLFSACHFENQLSMPDPLIVMASGNIIRLSSWDQVGGFDDKLFIDEVDHDFCLRLNLAGYRIRQVPVTIRHALGSLRTYRFLGKKPVFVVHGPVRMYYMIRNNLYMYRTYGGYFPDLIRSRKRMLARAVVHNLLGEPGKALRKLYFMCAGLSDFKAGRFGPFRGKTGE